ncbi:MAG: sulfotransferase [Deltaproteobacteria bacterium]|nr:sulfotransferase [Deltaproteobacteria bacterium]
MLNLAHYHSRGFDISKVKYVLYHLHTLQEDVSAELMEEFPEAKTIIMTRDPREGWVGWRKTVSYRNYGNVFLDDMEHFLSGVKKDLDQLIAFKKRHGSPIHIIDLAELHSNGREIMQGVCDFLHVDFDESLLESTFMGLKWWGNASDRKPVSGLDKNRGVKQFPTAMSPLEIAVFDDVFSQYKADFKYAPWELQMDQGEITGYLRREFRNQFFKIRFYLPNYRHILRLQSYFEEGYYRRLGHVAYLPDNRLVHSAVIWIYVCYRYICSAKVRLSHVIKVLRGNVNRSHSPRYQGSQKL